MTTVGPSQRRGDWHSFFTSPQWNPGEFQSLLRDDDPGAAFFEIETYINGLYRSVILAAEQQLRIKQKPDITLVDIARQKAQWVGANTQLARRDLGAKQRDIDLGLLRWMRRASCLSVVVGAGVTMDAGGPSWPSLVRQLLVRSLKNGFETSEMREQADSTPEHKSYARVVTKVTHFEPVAKARAEEIIAAIDNKSADTELLMEGAQLVHSLHGQHLFTEISGIIYEQVKSPGQIHKALAELAKPQYVADRGGWFPGWDGIVTYNFDDLMGEALDDLHIARASYAMRDHEIAGDPNPLALQAGQGAMHQEIYHLHGYTPRRLFLITKVQYCFSTSQYKKSYKGKRIKIIDSAFNRWLANPVHHALYVGCSFDDEAMNGLLREAAKQMPGRYHYALLKWPGEMPFAQSSAEDIAVNSARLESIGVRPIWFDKFNEIPELLGRLA